MKVINVGDTSPVSSIRRVRDSAVIPPYTFSGSLTVGSSPWWSPQSRYELTQAYVSARVAGNQRAGFAVMRVEGGLNHWTVDARNHTVLGSIIIEGSHVKRVFSLAGGIVTPYDSVYILSFAASGHQDVVIQILGELV